MLFFTGVLVVLILVLIYLAYKVSTQKNCFGSLCNLEWAKLTMILSNAYTEHISGLYQYYLDKSSGRDTTLYLASPSNLICVVMKYYYGLQDATVLQDLFTAQISNYTSWVDSSLTQDIDPSVFHEGFVSTTQRIAEWYENHILRGKFIADFNDLTSATLQVVDTTKMPLMPVADMLSELRYKSYTLGSKIALLIAEQFNF